MRDQDPTEAVRDFSITVPSSWLAAFDPLMAVQYTVVRTGKRKCPRETGYKDSVSGCQSRQCGAYCLGSLDRPTADWIALI